MEPFFMSLERNIGNTSSIIDDTNKGGVTWKYQDVSLSLKR